MTKIELYIIPNCPQCLLAQRLLNQKAAVFEKIDVYKDDAKKAWLKEVTGQSTLPQLFVNGRSFGGFDEMSALEHAGKLNLVLEISA